MDFPTGIAKADVSLTNDAEVNVSAGEGGFISVNANNLILSGGSELFAGIAENQGSTNAQAGDIIINASESVQLIGNGIDIEGLDTVISNHVGLSAIKRNDPNSNSTAIGNGGSIFIETDRLELSNRGVISAITFAQGDAGGITVTANSILLDTLGEIASRVRLGGEGNVGNVDITVNSLTIDNGFVISDVGDFDGETPGIARGNGGDVIINARDTVNLNSTEGLSLILSEIQKNGIGNAGNININTDSLSLGNQSLILTTNDGEGNSGNININASNAVTLQGETSGPALILSQLLNNVVGNAGDIVISSPLISLSNFSLISTNAQENSTGNSGNISIDADILRLTEGSIIDALTENNLNGGDINIDANFLELVDGGKIITSSNSGGNAGNINLNIANDIFLNNDNPPTESPFSETVLQNLTLETGLFANTFQGSTGNGGNIVVEANSIQLENNSSILAATSFGNGGNVTLNIEKFLSLSNNSLISAEAGSFGNGGNINIDTNFIVAFPNQNNDIIANAQQGRGGNININAESIFGIQENPVLNPITNDLNASSARGAQFNGNVAITTPEVDAIRGVTELPTTVIEAQQTTEEACAANSDNGKQNGLTVKGKGGILPSPNAIFSADALNIGGKIVADNNERYPSVPLSKGEVNTVSSQINAESTEIKPISTSHGDIYPARGIIKTADGRVILTAYPTDNVTRVPNRSVNCNNLTRSSTDQGIRSSRR